MTNRSYTELVSLPTFKQRFEYLKIGGSVGRETFGFERHLNQAFYRSAEWKRVRQQVIARDLGCDLAIEGMEIFDRIIIHHMNPITPDDIYDRNMDILHPEYLISVAHRTHNAIHYGDISLVPTAFAERKPGDTKLW